MTSVQRQRVGEQELIAAWYSDEPLADVAKRFHVPRKFIAMSWKLLKLRGKLPNTLRPCQLTSVRRGGNSSTPRMPSEVQPEDRTMGGPTVMALTGEDPLLEQLRAVHGRPRPDLYPGTEPE